MFEWLGGVDPSINHYNAVKLHLPGTGGWIFADDGYKTWENERNATLWLHSTGTSYPSSALEAVLLTNTKLQLERGKQFLCMFS